MNPTVRFAPSPTGNIHIGNARTALFNWLFALRQGGRFILRFDDTDATRSRQDYVEGIARDVAWLGIVPDAVARQSERLDLYEAAAARLRESGLLYPCYETQEELELRRRRRMARRLPPIYGREALALSSAERSALEAQGRRPHWRFLLPNFEAGDPLRIRRTETSWNDLVRGDETVDLSSLSDPVLVREDGTFLYTMTSVVDDIDMGVTHVIRGDDHLTNTGVQIALFHALGAEPPAFGHHNLLVAASGEALSKRSGALSIAGLREGGIEPMAVASLAVLTGSSSEIRAVPDMQTLAAGFDLGATSRSSAKFDPADLFALNRALLREMSFAGAAERLAGMGIVGPRAEDFWMTVRGNLERLDDARDWWRIVMEGPGTVELSQEDKAFVERAWLLLPDGPYDRGTWRIWTDSVKADTGRKGKALFRPLRLAITGREEGPELAELLPLLGPEGMLVRRP